MKWWALLLALAATPVQRTEWSDLTPAAQELSTQLGITETNWNASLTAIDNRTEERLKEGDWDDCAYYVLQSRTFTSEPSIEPAHLALEYKRSGQLPPAVHARVQAFLAALRAPTNDRQRYLARFAAGSDAGEIEAHLIHSLAFLSEKETGCEGPRPQDCIANLYADRGLSTDSSRDAIRAVEAGVQWLAQNRPALQARRILILGPGLDFIPRTGLNEDHAPQIYQPDQMRRLVPGSTLDCADVSPLVIEYAERTCAASYRLNISTGHVARTWDLIVATNILLYLNDRELLGAMANIRKMLRPGGILLHNDARFQTQVFGRSLGMPAIHFGSVTLDGARKPALVDHYVLHELSFGAHL